MLYEGGLLIGDRPTRVMNRIRANPSQFAADFVSEQNIQRLEIPVVSELDTKGIMSDNGAGNNKIGVRVKHETFTWSSPGNEDFVMFKYKVINTSTEVIDSMYVGIFADWDIMNYNLNKVAYNAQHQMAYTFSTEANGLYAGIKLLDAPMPPNAYALDLVSGGGGGVNLADGFSVSEKYTVLSTPRLTAGGTGTGNDVASVVSSGPFELAIGDSIEITYALLGGINLDNLLAASENAEIKFNSIITENAQKKSPTKSFEVFPNPAKSNISLINNTGSAAEKINIYSINGMLVKSLNTNNSPIINVDISDLSEGNYLIQLITKEKSEVKKIVIKR
jgi:hypothetical protein